MECLKNSLAEDLYEILRNPNNPVIISKKRDFQAYGIDIRFEDKALRKLAKMAFEEKTGARGLVSAVERVLIQFEKKLPSTDISELLVTSKIVDKPDQELEKLLADPLNPKLIELMDKAVEFDRQYLRDYLQQKKDHLARLHGLELDDLTMDLVTEMHLHLDVDVNSALREIYTMQNEVGEYELSFMERYGFKLSFTQKAFAEVVKKAIEQDVSALRVCENMSKEFDYAFRLIKERTGKQEFTHRRRSGKRNTDIPE